MRVICYHRYIEDWSKKKSFDIIPGMVHTNKRLENLNNIKEYWDNTFNMNFFNYRHEVQKIHIESVEKAGMYQVNDFFELLKIVKDDDIVVPTDDDDFFHPDIKNFLQFDQHFKKIIVWNYHAVNFNSFYVHSDNSPQTKDCLISCGYAIQGRYLKKIYEIKGSKYLADLLDFHWFVLNNKLELLHIPEFLSFYNYHSGSISQLHEKKEIKIRPTFRFPKNSKGCWFNPYVVKMYQLYERAGLFKHRLI